jgi:toxin HigB-1
MRVRSVRHKGLKRLIEHDDDRGIRPDLASRVRRIFTAPMSAQDIDGLEGPPGLAASPAYRRPGRNSISVSGNWRITCNIEDEPVTDLNFEDYH